MKSFFHKISNADSIRILRTRRGQSMLIAIFAMILTVTIAVEVSYDTTVGYVQAAQQINRLKAYYAAKSGIDLSLFRILIYRKVVAQYGQQLSSERALMDMIWQMPFSWPPVVPSSVPGPVRSSIKAAVKHSAMHAQYYATIKNEGARIDINALGCGNEAIVDATRGQLLNLFYNAMKTDPEFKRKYENYNFSKLIDNIEDWVSPGDQSVEGGDKTSKYKQPEDVENYHLPPDAPFKTLSELHMVAGMKDDFYNILKHRVTIYGTFGINVNYANAAILESLDPQITKEIADKIIARRTDPNLGGPYQNANDFYSYLQKLGVTTTALENNHVPLQFGTPENFRITSIGTYRNVVQKIDVITYDLDAVASRYATILNQNAAAANGQNPYNTPANSTPQNGTNPSQPPPQTPATPTPQEPIGKPRIVMWKVS